MNELSFRRALWCASLSFALGCVGPPPNAVLDGGEDAGHDAGVPDAGRPGEMFSCSTWQPAVSEVLDGGLVRFETNGAVQTFAVSDNRDQIAYQVADGIIVVRDLNAGTELTVTMKAAVPDLVAARSLAGVFGTRLSSSWMMLAGGPAKFQRFNFETCALDGPEIKDYNPGPNPSTAVQEDLPAMSGRYVSWTVTTVLGRDVYVTTTDGGWLAPPDTEVRVFNSSLLGDLAVWQATNSPVGYPSTFRWRNLVTGWNTERFVESHAVVTSTPLIRVSPQWTAWVDSAGAGSTVHVLETQNARDAGIIDLASGAIRPESLSLKNGVVAWAESVPDPVLAWVDLNTDGGVQRLPTPAGFGAVELHAKGLVFTVNGVLYLDPSFAP